MKGSGTLSKGIQGAVVTRQQLASIPFLTIELSQLARKMFQSMHELTS